MKATFLFSLLTIYNFSAFSQAIDSLSKPKENVQILNPVVVTGQLQIQSLKHSVYRVRQISTQRIQASGATNVQQVLNTFLGFRFSNDLTLGTADVELMGMSGRNLKILLDGVPLVDRADTRESLNQIDINSIEKIEIVEGPMSVMYGTDALAGVINLISKRPQENQFRLLVSLQEESAGKEFDFLDGKGQHQKNIAINWASSNLNFRFGFNQNDFGGWNEPRKSATISEVNALLNRWKPKSQSLANARVGYSKNNLQAWYRVDALEETISSYGGMNPNNFKAENQKFNTSRWGQQAQLEWMINRFKLQSLIAFTHLSRTSQTHISDYLNGTSILSNELGKQDKAVFDALIWRSTLNYGANNKWNLQVGLEVSQDRATGDRIAGSPIIQDYALFFSSESNIGDNLLLRPGLRFIKNTVYHAPKVIPSVNAKYIINSELDIRFAFAQGFRSPALRELYFDFFDASHAIMGNKNLKAETSNSVNISFMWMPNVVAEHQFQTQISVFYNDFRNRIDYGLDPNNPTITTLLNIDKFKTQGITLEENWIHGNLHGNIGISYLGRYNELVSNDLGIALPAFMWTPEITSNWMLSIPKVKINLNLFYKYLGVRPVYQLIGANDLISAKLVKIGDAQIADFMINKNISKGLELSFGIRNLFNTTQLTNSSLASGGAHSSSGASVPFSYGRSLIFGLKYNWIKNSIK
ncbi:MAG: TonB-dependent receptor [Pedobacter sp.]|nr:MAG: TonB-dependent receptor [Pedobacter sp.]